MTSLPGGGALRAGLHYEDLWLVQRVLGLLKGKATRIRLEPPGAAGVGIEFEVDIDGDTWGEQTKNEQNRWTINRLCRGGVIADAKTQISLGRHFRLIATTDARELAHLASLAKKAESFADYKESLTTSYRSDLTDIEEHWEVPEETAWRMLKRVDAQHIPEDALRMNIETQLESMYRDGADAVFEALRTFCLDTMYASFRAPEVLNYLESRGLRQSLFAGDQIAINELRETVETQDIHVTSFHPHLGLVARSDIGSLLDRLRHPDSGQVVVVDGIAGSGKSTVVTAVAKELQDAGWFVAVARMDGYGRVLTSRQLGRAMELGGRPSALLAGVSGGSSALLVIDQLDAVGRYGGRMTESFVAVHKTLDEIVPYPNVKVLLVTRTVDLQNDGRMVRLLEDESRVGRHTVGKLDAVRIEEHLVANKMDIPSSETTLELLRTPLHLAVFCRLPQSARATTYDTLQQLYRTYTDDVLVRLERERGFDHANWGTITGELVDYMSSNETLVTPLSVLERAAPAAVRDLISESILIDKDPGYSFFHETYFDFLFAQIFATSGRSLHDFLLESEQGLFRRAQTRQVLEYLAAEDRSRFISVVVELLTSEHIRFHLKDVVIATLGQIQPTAEDWKALDSIAWDGSSVGSRLVELLSQGGWFDVVDSLCLWEEWLGDSDKGAKAFDQVIRVARKRSARVAELVRPYIGHSEVWRVRFRTLVTTSLNKDLVDLTVELIESGQLDETRDPWSLRPLKHEDPEGTVRLIGAFLRRGLQLAQDAGSTDPFSSGHFSDRSSSCSVISDVADREPSEFVRHVLPFVVAVSLTGQGQPDQDRLPSSDLWGYRRRGSSHTVDGAIFEAINHSLEKLAVENPEESAAVIQGLLHAESEELRFLVCRMLTVMDDSDDAISWLLSDRRNLALGWADNRQWASRELIEKHSTTCSSALFKSLEELLLDYSTAGDKNAPEWRGYRKYQLLSAMSASRLSPLARRKLGELRRRLGRPSDPPGPVEVRSVESPIPEESTRLMSDDNWIRALKKHTTDEPNWDGPKAVGGAFHLAQQLGRRAEEDPERFAKLSLRFDQEIPVVSMSNLLDNVSEAINNDLLARICEHAADTYGLGVAQSVCQAIHRTKAGSPTTARILASYSHAQDEPESEEDAHTLAREWAALAAGSVLLSGSEHIDDLLPIIETLASDQSLRVRYGAAYAVHVLSNHDQERAFGIAENLFETPEVLNSENSERLLCYAVLRRPDRFAPILSHALQHTDTDTNQQGHTGSVPRRAGRIWAVAYLRNKLLPSITNDVQMLPTTARMGAAEVFAANPTDSLDLLPVLFDDDDPEVQQHASYAIKYLEELPPDEQDDLLDALVQSKAFPERKSLLFIELRDLPGKLPKGTIAACELAVEPIGDISTAEAGLGGRLSDVVVRLYRESNDQIRKRCLDIIDNLVESNVFDIQRRLDQERQ